MKNNQTTTEGEYIKILEILSVDHDGIDEDGSVLTYKVVSLKQAQGILRTALAKEKKAVLEEVKKEVIGEPIEQINAFTRGRYYLQQEQLKKLQSLAHSQEDREGNGK